ncbi:ribonuclease-III-like-domain-containing protein [Endogone sp. FLAS-F59071]|nr:ribonuclease-III-like-domain-containing protein [Endogone sp. FLAS-F59071]|eukprot:RUS20399.1 ribonuclease-III-like-domain-containing protein [Endogone sp. FLAS-F59071]
MHRASALLFSSSVILRKLHVLPPSVPAISSLHTISSLRTLLSFLPQSSSPPTATPDVESVTSDGGDTREIATRLGLDLSDSLLTQVFTHKSYKHGFLPTNERLETIGRRFLEFYVTDRVDKEQPEGDLPILIKPHLEHTRMARLGKAMGLGKVVRYTLPASTEVAGKNSVLVTAFHALIGAIYHDKARYYCLNVLF